jgi:uncharacterized membrane protein YfcA
LIGSEINNFTNWRRVADDRIVIPALRRLPPPCALSIVGRVIGAALLLWSGDQVFRMLVPWLLLLATAIFAAGPYFQNVLKGSPERRHRHGNMPLAMAVQTPVAVYGGYFGAGMGVMMLASLTMTDSNG